MKHFLEITFELLAAFTGNKGGIEYGIVPFGLAGIFWLGLLILAFARQKDNSLPHEKLLLLGFSLGFCRELFMMVMVALPAYGLYSVASLHVIFPPIEHAIFDIALVVIAAGYVQYLLHDKLLSYRIIKIGIFLVSSVYLSTAIWWGKYILANPESKFGQVWCDWLFRINASVLLFIVISFFVKKTSGWKRNAVSTAIFFLFLNQFLKIPDMISGEVYEQYFTPVRNGFYILGIPIFGYIYIRELYEERKLAIAKLLDSHDVLKKKNLELEQTEHTLRESEKKFRQLHEGMRDGFGVADMDGNIIEVNKSFAEIVGYSKQALYKLTYPDITPKKWLTTESQIIQEQVLKRGFSDLYEKEYIKKDGSHVPVELRAVCIKDDDSNPSGIWVSVRDIAKRKQTENALRKVHNELELKVKERTEDLNNELSERMHTEAQLKQSEKKLRAWLESSPVCTKIVDLDFNLQYMSDAGIKGLNLDDITQFYGKPYPFDFYPESFNNLMTSNLEKVKETSKVIEQEGCVNDINGNEIWFHSILVPVNDDADRLDYIMIVSNDITDRKMAEIRLSYSNLQLDAVLNNLDSSIYIADMNSYEIVYMNDHIKQEFKKDLTGNICWKSFHDNLTGPCDFCTNDMLIAADGTPDKPYVWETYNQKTDKWYELHDQAIPWTDGRLVRMEIAVDITARKMAEKSIFDSLSEKTVLLREIHHRVKNNMQVILSLLRMHQRKSDSKGIGKIFNDCRDRINAMSLIHESLYQSENLARINFEDYLKKLCRNLERVYKTSQKKISLELKQTDVTLDMDQGIAIGMVIAELVSNAFKHAFLKNKGGRVLISLSRLDDDSVKLIIKDNGKGTPKKIDIFNSSSLGLRLAVATVTRELDGSIDIERDNGTKYIIQFTISAHRKTK